MLQVNREFEEHSNSGWRYITACEHKNPIPDGFQTDQQTQTATPQPLRVKDTGAQYSSPSDSSDSDSSDSE